MSNSNTNERVAAQDVRRVAELANLELTSEEEVRMQRDLNAIVDYIGQLNELDTSRVEPMAQVAEVLDQFPSSCEPTARSPLPGGRVDLSVMASGHGDSGIGAGNAPASLRADEQRKSLPREAVMAAAPETDGTFFKVPKVIER